MNCTSCGGKAKTIHTAVTSGNVVKRRRECINPACRERFTTYETHHEQTPRPHELRLLLTYRSLSEKGKAAFKSVLDLLLEPSQ